MRRLAALLTVPLLVALAACGDDSGDDGAGDETTDSSEPSGEETQASDVEPAGDDPVLDGVSVSGDLGDKPEVEVEAPLEVDGAFRRLLIEGDGEALTSGVQASIHYTVLDGVEGSELEDSYGTLPQTVEFPGNLPQGMLAGLAEVPLGSRVVTAADAPSMYGQSVDLESQGISPDDVLVLVMDVLEPGPERAEGTEVDPPEGLPTVTLGDDGAPSVEIPDEDPPGELVSELLIEGEGDEVPEGGTVRAQYTGVLWEDGSVFDSSWERGQPATFGLSQVVDGWAQGLTGVPVGSQVLLVIPPELGYGSEGTGDGAIPGGATLVFVVDILDAAPPQQQPTGQQPGAGQGSGSGQGGS